MVLRHRLNLIVLLSLLFLASGCATSTGITRTNSDSDAGDASFGNFLVVGIAENYTNRAQYERTVVSLLRGHGASATAYYQAVGGNKPINRDSVREVLEESSYDAVLVTRVLDRKSELNVKSGSTAAKVTRRNDSPIDFFRYNYEELNEPDLIAMRTDANLVIELYSAADESLVWTMEISKKGVENVGELIDDVAKSVVQRLNRDKRIVK
ncbi:MAG: hypothetical protein IIA07_11895 [Proteobacteria bacterium]|nr:hypothetical protein [Pseudomonadota bacterium]